MASAPRTYGLSKAMHISAMADLINAWQPLKLREVVDISMWKACTPDDCPLQYSLRDTLPPRTTRPRSQRSTDATRSTAGDEAVFEAILDRERNIISHPMKSNRELEVDESILSNWNFAHLIDRAECQFPNTLESCVALLYDGWIRYILLHRLLMLPACFKNSTVGGLFLPLPMNGALELNTHIRFVCGIPLVFQWKGTETKNGVREVYVGRLAHYLQYIVSGDIRFKLYYLLHRAWTLARSLRVAYDKRNPPSDDSLNVAFYSTFPDPSHVQFAPPDSHDGNATFHPGQCNDFEHAKRQHSEDSESDDSVGEALGRQLYTAIHKFPEMGLTEMLMHWD